MKSWKWKILTPIIFITLIFVVFWALYEFPVSSGKRVGNLTKISKKGKFYFTKTWEGTIDEGSGDKLTTYFSVSSDKIGEELYAYEGKEVILYYEEHFVGWPRDTKYDILSWKPKNDNAGYGNPQVDTSNSGGDNDSAVSRELSKTLLCSFLGSLYQDPELYDKVKSHIESSNLYLFNQYERCNK